MCEKESSRLNFLRTKAEDFLRSRDVGEGGGKVESDFRSCWRNAFDVVHDSHRNNMIPYSLIYYSYSIKTALSNSSFYDWVGGGGGKGGSSNFAVEFIFSMVGLQKLLRIFYVLLVARGNNEHEHKYTSVSGQRGIEMGWLRQLILMLL